MAKATTFRLDPQVRAGLFKLSEVVQVPANRLANEALREYVDRRIADVEQEMEATLEDLRRYRKRDPDFEHAIAEVVKAEMSVKDDPAEGRVVSEPAQAGTTQARLRGLLEM